MSPSYNKDIKEFMFKVPLFGIKKALRLIGFYRRRSLYYFSFDRSLFGIGVCPGDIISAGSGWENDPILGNIPKIYFPDQWDLHYHYKIDINPYHDLLRYCESKSWKIESKSFSVGNGLHRTIIMINETTQSSRNKKLNEIGIK